MTRPMESHCISFREIPHTTKLFSSFLEDFDRVSAYYAHPPTAVGIDAAAREVKLDPRVRRSVVEILREQNRQFGPGGAIDSATARNLDRLAAGAVAIVTGQQVGLFSARPTLFTRRFPPFAALRRPRSVESKPSRFSGSRPAITISPR